MAKILKQKEEMLQYHPKGFMKKFVKDNYEHLQKRVEEIKSDKEYNDAFYPGQYYEIHSSLYSKLGKKLIVEMSLLMALSILFIMDYERLQKTNDLVDATRTGKRIMDCKAFAGTLSGILFSAILYAVLHGFIFFTAYPSKDYRNVYGCLYTSCRKKIFGMVLSICYIL